MPNRVAHPLDAGHFAWEEAAGEYGRLVSEWIAGGRGRASPPRPLPHGCRGRTWAAGGPPISRHGWRVSSAPSREFIPVELKKTPGHKAALCRRKGSRPPGIESSPWRENLVLAGGRRFVGCRGCRGRAWHSFVLPLLVEDHVQARPNGVVAVRVTWGTRMGTDPVEFLSRDRADRLSELVHTLPSEFEATVESPGREQWVRCEEPGAMGRACAPSVVRANCGRSACTAPATTESVPV